MQHALLNEPKEQSPTNSTAPPQRPVRTASVHIGAHNNHANHAASLPAGRSGRRLSGYAPRMTGNQAQLRALSTTRSSFQRSPMVNQPGDLFEQEADQVADRIIRMSVAASDVAPGLFTGAGTSSDRNQQDSRSVRQPVQAQLAGGLREAEAPQLVHEVLRSSGHPLDPATRDFMEPRLGQNLGDVRIHIDSRAADSALQIGARAYTVASNIAFGPGQFTPATTEGRRLLAHELAHVVQQRGARPRIQRQPAKPADNFDFMVGEVDGQQHVFAVNRPTAPGEFLDAFQTKGMNLIDAEFRWLSNNLIDFTRDAVLKEKRNPYANVNVKTLKDVTSKAFEKVVGALLVKGAAKVIGGFAKLIYIGKDVLYVGETAGRFAGLGGLLASLGASLVQALIGPIFDKTQELVKQGLQQFAEAMKKLNNDLILPQVRDTSIEFHDFMANLRAFLLQDTDETSEESKKKPANPKFSVGQGAYQVKFELDRRAPVDVEQVIVELGNVVLGIDTVMPHLDTDRSLYQDLALRAGVFSEDTAQASPGEGTAAGKPDSSFEKPFKVARMVVGETRFNVPANGSVTVTSEASYTDEDWEQISEEYRPPSSYSIELYKVNEGHFKGDSAVGPSRTYQVSKPKTTDNKPQTGSWYKLDAGKYYLVISKGGNPGFTLQGKLRVEVRHS
jgi:hypothetical protein